MDAVFETILEILGPEVARRVLRPQSPTVAQPSDQPVYQSAPGFPSELTLHHDQMQGPPCDVVDELMEDRLIDRLLSEDDECGCNQRLTANCRKRCGDESGCG
jgi:hypothetical protein